MTCYLAVSFGTVCVWVSFLLQNHVRMKFFGVGFWVLDIDFRIFSTRGWHVRLLTLILVEISALYFSWVLDLLIEQFSCVRKLMELLNGFRLFGLSILKLRINFVRFGGCQKWLYEIKIGSVSDIWGPLRLRLENLFYCSYDSCYGKFIVEQLF